MKPLLRMLLGGIILGACVPGTPHSSSGSGGGRACTEIGCVDAFTLTLRTSDGSAPVGDHTIDLQVDKLSLLCTFSILGIPSDTTVRCSPRVTVHLSSTIAGRFVEQVSVMGSPAAVRIIQRLGDVVLLDRSFSPAYRKTQPNGPGCDPICNQTQQEIELPLPSELWCDKDADCVHSLFVRPVIHRDDCYCVTCGGSVPASQSARFESQWKAICTGWEPAPRCPFTKCVEPRPGECQQHQCR